MLRMARRFFYQLRASADAEDRLSSLLGGRKQPPAAADDFCSFLVYCLKDGLRGPAHAADSMLTQTSFSKPTFPWL